MDQRSCQRRQPYAGRVCVLSMLARANQQHSQFKTKCLYSEKAKPEPGPGHCPKSTCEYQPSLASSKQLEITFRPAEGSGVDRSRSKKTTNMFQSQSPSTTDGVQSDWQHQTKLDSIFTALEENLFAFVKKELKSFQEILSPDCEEPLENQTRDEEQAWRGKKALMNIIVHFLRRMKEGILADQLESKYFVADHQGKLKSCLKNRFSRAFKGDLDLDQIYTELCITEGWTGGVNDEHEVRQIERESRKQRRPETIIREEDIFKPPPGRDQPIRTVMTKGVAGIGKTVLTQKFTLDWAENKAHRNIHFIFPFTFRELNVLKEKKFSLVELIHHFFTEIKGVCSFEDFQVLFILDGLDESRLPLDFHNKEILTDVTKSTSVDVLLTNLIRGKLLPSALLWITTRPAAASQIPPDLVDLVTEVRGFSDPQKEEYFRKRLSDEEQASRMISNIKASRSLYIMCHIPVFCWITATVQEDVLETREGGELPSTLTELYVHFLVRQTRTMRIKYCGGTARDSVWDTISRKMIESLGKLAFDQLQKGNLNFYESDLTECGIDIRAASVYSGVFTQIFKEERGGLYRDKVFCFVHLSVQEFLAALHVHQTFVKFGLNVLEEQANSRLSIFKKAKLKHLHRGAVDKALGSPNGHLDLFLRFLLGLSVPNNQNLLQGFLKEKGFSAQTNQETVWYIKGKISENESAEKSINLFHCLNELNDRSLVDEIQQFLCSGSLSTDKLSPAQWSALVFMLVSSTEGLEVFDLKRYSASEDVLLRLVPVVKASNKALLASCNLSDCSCEALSLVLGSNFSRLTELDLSNNDLHDSGVRFLSAGLQRTCCKLESLRLSGCLIKKAGFTSLVSALESNPSHLRDLDLSYNHPRDSDVQQLSSLQQDPNYRLENVRVKPAGVQWLIPGLRKYACHLTIDMNTVNRNLKLSANGKVTRTWEDQPYPDHADRFKLPQLLSRDCLTDRSYWEVEWTGIVDISVSYRGIRRTESKQNLVFGRNAQSWSLECSDDRGGYSAWHGKRETYVPSFSSVSNKVAVYLDCPAGILSFYRVSSDSLVHLHTFNTTFIQPLYAGFTIRCGSSVTLC